MAVTPSAYERVTSMLDSVSWRGMKPGLDRTRALLTALGDPDHGLHGVLVAGTNGKGSVCATVDAIARAAGLRTVLLTKPHLVSYTERFVRDGHPAGEGEFAALMQEVDAAARTLPDSLEPTAFEMLTAAGILFAARAVPDLLVCEVGLGGRLDSTNVLDLGVAVVTNVALDHRETLGDTIPIIAREKAAIIKPGDVAVTGAVGDALAEVRARATDVAAPLAVVGGDVAFQGRMAGLDGVQVETVFDGAQVAVDAPLLGAYQVDNVATAIATCDSLRRRGAAIDSDAVRQGCERVRWPGRLQWVPGSPSWLVDGAHNPAGMAAMVDSAKLLLAGRQVVALFGVMRDKDREGMIAALRRLEATSVVVTAAAVERATPPQDLAHRFEDARPAATVAEAMDIARELAGPDGVVVACGSLYLVGEVLAGLGAL
ncbi:MAG: bifunctional folylpolyglutamate synthase/dihydrofolate synthase [Candidatus Dormibacteraeota bacterium]|nr:bifunctional folylpolyglutamate synthase/dihydrofolate synthase [Candidatus Dormibacteraeota bacterium]